MAAENGLGPGFSPSGQNATVYGEKEGFPVADHSLAVQPGEPYDVKYRVGAYSHFDEIYPTRRIKHAANPWMFKRSKADIRYSFQGNQSSVAEYLSRNPVTGLLIAKDDEILFEHYQYGRTDSGSHPNRWRSRSQRCWSASLLAKARSAQWKTRQRSMCRDLRGRNMARRRSATCSICPPAWNSARRRMVNATSTVCGSIWCSAWGRQKGQSTA